jgi:glutamate racemase
VKIGIYDSGVGGLSVMEEIIRLMPNEEYIYYADVDNVPYGEKSREEVVALVVQAMDFMLQHQVKAVVIACNTATSAAIAHLRATYSLPVIGMEPAVKIALNDTGAKRVLLLATPLTLQEAKLNDLLSNLDVEHRVDKLALPGLVMFAEQENFSSSQVDAYLQREFAQLHKEDYSVVVLGCTHFNYFKDRLAALFPQPIVFVDGNAGTARHLHYQLQHLGLLEQLSLSIDYYYSGKKVDSSWELAKIARLRQRLQQMRDL